MPASKATVASFLDHGVVATPAVARTFDAEPTIKAADPAPGETMILVMAEAKKVQATKVKGIRDLSVLIPKAKNPLELATLLIGARYEALGGAKGFLGAATTGVTVCPDSVGYYRHYNGGSIYWSPATGAHEVHGLIRQKWAGLGWERSSLGYPRTDETVGHDEKKEGRFNHFQGGSIYWHPQTGAFEVHGAILAKYRELGAEASLLGYPTTDETATPDRVGRFNHFQRGSIYWTPSTWAHEVHGLIRSYWAEKGWERNPQLGYPLTDELIPHRGIGHTAGPSRPKPLGLPFDVLKNPAVQPSPHLKAVTTKEDTTTKRAVASTSAPKLATPAATTTAVRAGKSTATTKPTVAAVSMVKLGGTAELVAAPSLTLDPSILINDHKGRSDDRYSDFEDGVLFWRRKTGAVTQISPRAKSPSGTGVAFTAAEIASLVGARVRAALASFPGATPGAATFVGTTGYSYDGAGVHNRAHRLRVPLTGRIAGGATAALVVEVTAEISLDPIDREIVGYLTGWHLIANPGGFSGGGDNIRQLHLKLDPVLWKQFLVTKVPATSENPIAILSVKTHSDGRVATYFEL